MANTVFRLQTLAIAVMTVGIGACAREPSRDDMAKATEGYVIEDTNKLFVVDCLLPGQVRKLGSEMTYLSQRRPIRTTAADCEVRGGEYVAYDRANYASALKIWLPRAQEGDATAQLYVGEIFEKGLGQQVDYRAAAQWYRKAADQGNFQAQLNLGHLYEKGQGVAKDPAEAFKWYRKASGLDEAGLQFAPAVSAERATLGSAASGPASEELASLRSEVERSRKESEQLRAQLQDTRQQLLDQQDALRKAQDELEDARGRLQQQKSSSSSVDSPELKALEQELRQKEASLKAQQAKVSRMAASLNQERQVFKREQLAQKAGSSQAQAQASADSLEASLSDKINEYQRQSAELTDWLTRGNSADRARIDQRKQALQAQAREIVALKDKLEQQNNKAQQNASLAAVGNGPNIEIIEPPVTLTRGMPSIQTSASETSKQIVGRIAAPSGLTSLMLNNKPLQVDASGMFRSQVDLGAGNTPVHIIATDKQNKRSEMTLTLIGANAQAEAYPATPSGDKGQRYGDVDFGQFYALIIGNNAYRSYPTLSTAINDAKSLEVLLRERYGFKTKVLLNANRHAIMSALNEFNKKLTDKDNLLIYYAGHGEIDKSSQTAYWLPTDAEVGNPANWISSQSITEFLSIMPAKHVIVVADSCYSGALTGSAVAKLPEGMDQAKRERWLKAMSGRKARTVLTSGGVQPVMDQGGGEHSVFAKAFLNVLRGNKRVIEDYDIFRDVANQVRSSASQAGFDQAPQYAPLQHAGHEGSPFFFVPEV